MKLEELLRKVSRPVRYIGGEFNSVVKGKARVRIALVYPDIYEIGMSYIGLTILYSLLNEKEDVAAERIFMPDKDMVELLRSESLPIFSLETKRPLASFDLIAFSLLYELNYTNLLWILHLGDIPLLSSQRQEHHPIVAAGGPCTANPEPLADFVDFFYIGDGEPFFEEAVEILKSERNRSARLAAIAELEGVYVPSLHLQRRRKHPKGYWFLEGLKIKKRIVQDLRSYPFPVKKIVPHTEAVFDRVSWEIARGCGQRCRFCQATFFYAPLRVRPAPEILDGVKQSLIQTGYEAFSLSSLNTADYPQISSLMARLAVETDPWKISMSVSSLRPHIMRDPEFASALALVRKAGFTIVPEAGTERLRRVINKDVSDSEIEEACRNAFSTGWTSLKLYFMIGLPTETDRDLEAIAELVRKVSSIGKEVLGRKPQIHVSVSNFIPKPHTPFQWLGFETAQELKRKQLFLFNLLKPMRNVKISMHTVEQSFVEAYLARADWTAGKVLLSVWKQGGMLEAWRDKFSFELWKKAWKQEGIEPLIYTGSFEESEPLPWEHVDLGVHRDYLLAEFEKAFKEEPTPSCLQTVCKRCKGCDYWRIFVKRPKVELVSKVKLPERKEGAERRYWVYYRKEGPASFLSQTDLVRTVERIFRRAGISIAFTKGFHPRAKLSFPPALPVGVEGREEVFEVHLHQELSPEDIERLNRYSIEGLVFLRAERRQEKLSTALKYALYSIDKEAAEILHQLGYSFVEGEGRILFLHDLSKPSPARRLREAGREDLVFKMRREGFSRQPVLPPPRPG